MFNYLVQKKGITANDENVIKEIEQYLAQGF
jgi:hypothetical protein